MSKAAIRRATPPDVPSLMDLYNYYVANTAITFDTEPWTLEQRQAWFDNFAERERHQLFVATIDEQVVGYSCSGRFRAKAAYATSVETSVYLAAGAVGKGLGTRLYQRLFAALEGTGAHRALAGITLPNAASRALHQRSGFRSSGVMHEVGHKLNRYWDVEWFERKLK